MTKVLGWMTALCCFGLGVADAQVAGVSAPPYVRSEAMVTARDGARLHIAILRPAGSESAGAPLPFVMLRTPYGVADFTAEWLLEHKPELAASRYIFVFGDIRGRYASEGQFVMNRPVVEHRTKKDVDETTDTPGHD